MLKQGKVVNVTTRLRVRNKAGTTGTKIIGYKYNGNILTLDKSQKVSNTTWYRIKGSGWVSGQYVKITKDLEPKGDDKKPETKPKDPKKTDKPAPKPKPSNDGRTGNKKYDSKGTVKSAKDKKINRGSADEVSSTTSMKSMSKASDAKTDTKKTKVDQFADEYSKTGLSSWLTKNYRTGYTNSYIKNIEGNLKQLKVDLNIDVTSDSGNRKFVQNSYYYDFNRFKMAFPDVQLEKCFAHIYFTRPNFNICTKMNQSVPKGSTMTKVEDNPLLYFLANRSPDILKMMTSGLTDQHEFHPLLSNLAESFEPSDEYIEKIEYGESLTGYKILYGTHDIRSKSDGQFSIDFTEDKELSVYKTLELWKTYISNVYRGIFLPLRTNALNKILDYAVSVYYFVTDERDEEILFWTKYYGVFPTGAPSGNLRWDKGKLLTSPNYSVNFMYSFKEDYNPLALVEFNGLSKVPSNNKYSYREDYNAETSSVTNTWVGAPFIEFEGTGTETKFKLRHRDNTIKKRPNYFK